MSFNVLIITEDFINDQHITKPLVSKICEEIGKPNANVQTCFEPRFTGIEDCTNVDKIISEVIEMYEVVDLFLLLVDRDCNNNRIEKLTNVEKKVKPHLKPHQLFLAEQAWQEIEVWALAGQTLPKKWSWPQIRNERDPKEKYFYPLVKQLGLEDYPYQGRKQLIASSLQNWSRMKKLCPEDIGRLIGRLRESFTQQ